MQCERCGQKIKIPDIYDKNHFDGQVACQTCRMVYRLKMRANQVKKFIPVVAFA